MRSSHDGLTIALREVCMNDTIPHLREVLHKSECSSPWPRRVYETERRRWGMCHTMLDNNLNGHTREVEEEIPIHNLNI